MLTWVATLDFNIVASIATPCSVNTLVAYRLPPCVVKLEVENFDFKFSNSSLVKTKLNLSGNLSLLFFTASLIRLVST